MNAKFDYDLTLDQWETLKALRVWAPKTFALNQSVLEGLIALQLVAMCENLPVMTSHGRKVLVRGSPRLWDVAA
jgi:hypothetical protein